MPVTDILWNIGYHARLPLFEMANFPIVATRVFCETSFRENIFGCEAKFSARSAAFVVTFGIYPPSPRKSYNVPWDRGTWNVMNFTAREPNIFVSVFVAEFVAFLFCSLRCFSNLFVISISTKQTAGPSSEHWFGAKITFADIIYIAARGRHLPVIWYRRSAFVSSKRLCFEVYFYSEER